MAGIINFIVHIKKLRCSNTKNLWQRPHSKQWNSNISSLLIHWALHYAVNEPSQNKKQDYFSTLTLQPESPVEHLYGDAPPFLYPQHHLSSFTNHELRYAYSHNFQAEVCSSSPNVNFPLRIHCTWEMGGRVSRADNEVPQHHTAPTSVPAKGKSRL